ncbi:hypothetical protein BpHYR1_039287 [Brachionus plicatilis]|uniref:Uncharacterized protein n=1 Tax=Brachionus plicatilis TaxID=10195 RepID=A0A3M7PTM4_BRAPC|nr:hypothetical protein BpHYR1_039287 [Brachionus plicatilis]
MSYDRKLFFKNKFNRSQYVKLRKKQNLQVCLYIYALKNPIKYFWRIILSLVGQILKYKTRPDGFFSGLFCQIRRCNGSKSSLICGKCKN